MTPHSPFLPPASKGRTGGKLPSKQADLEDEVGAVIAKQATQGDTDRASRLEDMSSGQGNSDGGGKGDGQGGKELGAGGPFDMSAMKDMLSSQGDLVSAWNDLSRTHSHHPGLSSLHLARNALLEKGPLA